ncbi:hypothetical protein JSMCR1_p491 (plasmid) [Escherichia coli]|nr:hypothetical protein JSMCR1_p491 [Escherichia coli]
MSKCKKIKAPHDFFLILPNKKGRSRNIFLEW